MKTQNFYHDVIEQNTKEFNVIEMSNFVFDQVVNSNK